MSATWYEVLGVARDASTAEIRDAWRDAIADFDPTDRRFGLYNDAAKVLLDADARAAYDATLPEPEPELAPDPAAEPSEPDPEPAPVLPAPSDLDSDDELLADDDLADLDSDDAESDAAADARADSDDADDELEELDPNPAPSGDRPERGRPVPAWLLIALALATLVCAGVAAYVQFSADDSDETEDAISEARAVAADRFGDVLTYRWDDLEGSRERAAKVLTPAYYENSFAATWSLVQASAKEVKAVVKTDVLATGVVRASDDAKRVELVAVLRNQASNAAGDQGTGFIMVGLTMVEKGGTWLVDDISGIDGGDAGAEDGAGESGAGSTSPEPSAAPAPEPDATPAD